MFTERPNDVPERTDDESDRRRGYRPTYHRLHHHHHHNDNEVQPSAEKPSTCDTTYDAVSIIRGQLFIFKDKVRKNSISISIDNS